MASPLLKLIFGFTLVANCSENLLLRAEIPGVPRHWKCLVFEEPLIPIGSADDDQFSLLSTLIETYCEGKNLENLQLFEDYLNTNPNSPWCLSLRVNLGLMHRHLGQVTEALRDWEIAWEAGKTMKDPIAVAFTDRALGELMEAYAGLGNAERLSVLVEAAEARPVVGPLSEKLSAAKESLAYMRLSPETAFRCGPMALAYLKATESPLAFADPVIHGFLSTEKGTTLAMNARWARQIGLSVQMAKRITGAEIPVPSMVHFKLGHFAAVMAIRGGRYLVQDPFLGDTWVSLATLDVETTGFALVPTGTLPTGWTPVGEPEGERVWGKGAWGPGRPDGTRPDSVKISTTVVDQTQFPACVAYHVDLASLSLNFPLVTYTPAFGPRVDFRITYNQREYGQPRIFDYCNLGSKWTFSFLACLKDDTTNPEATITLCNPGGGGQTFLPSGNGSYRPEDQTQARLFRLEKGGYRLDYPSGRKEIYDLPDRAWGLRRIVLTHVQDALGNEVKLTWDASLRLVAITDAAGLVTKIGYESKDPLRITSVTDPFGRTANCSYDASGRLVQLTDCQEQTFRFTYEPEGVGSRFVQDRLTALTAPNGRSVFRAGETLVGPSYRRWVETTGPGGVLERLESGAGYGHEIPPEQLPLAPELSPDYHPLAFRFRESFFWAAGAYQPQKPDYRLAEHIRWGHGPGGYSSGIILSQKRPREGRHFFVHTGEFWGGVYPGSRKEAYPLTSGGSLKPGQHLVNEVGSPSNQGILAPVFDGNRALVTREYWKAKDSALLGIIRDYDLTGRLVHEVGPSWNWNYHWAPGRQELLAVEDGKSRAVSSFTYDDLHRLASWAPPKGPRFTFLYGQNGRLRGWRLGQKKAWNLQYDNQGRLISAGFGTKVWKFAWDGHQDLESVQGPDGVRKGMAAGAGDTCGIGRPLAIPAGCELAFGSVLDGIQGPLILRLLARS